MIPVHRRLTAGTAATLLVVGLAIAVGPAIAGAATEAVQTTQAHEQLDTEANVELPDVVAPGETFTADASALETRGDVTAVCWRFDEGETCHDAVATHAFDEVGSHTATLIITNADGEIESSTVLIAVTEEPTATLTVSDRVEAGAEVELDASDSTDDRGIDRFKWDLTGDGTVDKTTDAPTITHVFEDATDVEVSVTAVDMAGQTDTASASINVQEAAVETEDAAGINDGILDGSASIVLVVIGLLATLAVGLFPLSRSLE